MKEQLDDHKVEVWAWCLMTNQLHLIAVPDTQDGLAKAIGRAHQRYTRMVNFRQQKRGYLFQGRFHSRVMEESYFPAPVSYIELNPVGAKMCEQAWEYRWSRARFHVGLRKTDPLVRRLDLLGMESSWRVHLLEGDQHGDLLRQKTRTGRPCGDEEFVRKMESCSGRRLIQHARLPPSMPDARNIARCGW